MSIFCFGQSPVKDPYSATQRQVSDAEGRIEKLTHKKDKLSGRLRELRDELNKEYAPTVKAVSARTKIENKVAKFEAQLQRIAEQIGAQRETVQEKNGLWRAMQQNTRDDIDDRRIAEARVDDCARATATVLVPPQSVRAPQQPGPKAFLTPAQEAGANLIDRDTTNGLQKERARPLNGA